MAREKRIGGKTFYFDSVWGSKREANGRAKSLRFSSGGLVRVIKVRGKKQWEVWGSKRTIGVRTPLGKHYLMV